jgi:transaldolase
MKTNPLKKLEALGQSIWLDYIKRDLITSGKLKQLIGEDGLRGITSNPSIFEKAIAESNEYDKDIQTMITEGKDVKTIYETLTQRDVRDAANEFLHLYNKTDGKDGYVSLEVNPHLSHDTKGTIEEARRLWKALNRPNVLIKVAGTIEGLPAIKQLISEGINVNVTLLFGVPRYKDVAEAYIAGLEVRAARGEPLKHIASVASFFLSRIDVLIDPMLEKLITQGVEMSLGAKKLQGQVAIASANMAYQVYNEIINHDRFKKLAEKGAQVQRLLWASTSTKNSAYSDVKYIEALIGPDTVNTIPMETLDAYCDHGDPKESLGLDVTEPKSLFQTLADVGINIDKVTQQLEDEGIDKFNKSFDQLQETLEKKLPKKVF